MTHLMNLHNNPFVKIKAGTKTVEMRLYDERRQTICVGDNILFTNIISGEQLLVEVISLHVFVNFEQLYAKFDKVAIGYDSSEVADYKDMNQYYTDEQIARCGVVGIGIKLC